MASFILVSELLPVVEIDSNCDLARIARAISMSIPQSNDNEFIPQSIDNEFKSGNSVKVLISWAKRPSLCLAL
jgi:hypothetical protein